MLLGRIDRYLLNLMVRPVLGCLAITLSALLLERVLRIFAQLADNGGDFGFVFELAVNLVPYYLTLALPVSFFVGIFFVIARLGEGSELDALMNGGLSITRIAAPFIGLGIVFCLVSLILFGFLQPYGRYAYKVVLNTALHAGWNAQLQPQVFVDPGHGLTLTADRVNFSGRGLEGVFVRIVTPNGDERILSAKTGKLGLSPDGRQVELALDTGSQIQLKVGKPPQVVNFNTISSIQPIAALAQSLAPRGVDPRELTTTELVRDLGVSKPALTKRTMAAELYARMARALSVPFLPLLAFPMGMAAKRGKRLPGLILAGVLLIGFHHAVQTVQTLGQMGKLAPAPSIWGVYFIFVGLCSWLFLSSLKRPGETPLSQISVAIGERVAAVRARLTAPLKAAA